MVQVIKATGEKEPFSEEKVRNSIKRAGVPQPLEEQVLKQIKDKLYENIPTYEVYETIMEGLSKSEQPYSKAKYSLKQAIMMLGPTGYPFEDFIANLLQAQGYQTLVRQIITGTCVNHEIDVVAEKGNTKILIEAKFHNNPGTRSDIHVPLYVKSRFEDIKTKHNFDEAWVITNTKTSLDANAYADCIGMKVLSWNYPNGNSLRDMIERTTSYPITMLTTLTASHKVTLMNNQVLLCKELLNNPDQLKLLGLSHKEQQETMQELQYITSSSHERE